MVFCLLLHWKHKYENVFTVQKVGKYLSHSYQMYTCLLKPKLRNNFLFFMKQKGVEVSAHFVPPLHRQKYLIKYSKNNLKNTDFLSRSIVTLPIYPNLRIAELKKIFLLIDKWYEKIKKS